MARQHGIRRQIRRDDHQIRSELFATGEAHGFHSAIPDHGIELQIGGVARFDDHDFAAAFSQRPRSFRRQPSADHHRPNSRAGRIHQLPCIVQRAENENTGLIQTADRRNLRTRTGGQNQLVVTGPIAVAAANRPIQPVDLLHPDAKASPDAMLLVPLDVV